jgi:hypothetical protein
MSRNRNKQGIPELCKFDQEFERVYDSLESRTQSGAKLSSTEQAVVDVCGVIGFIEGNGLHSFWYNDLDQVSIIQSFRMIGADQVADGLLDSSWAKPICERGADKEGQLLSTEEEERKLDEIEERIYDGFQDAADRALQFVHRNRIKG